MATENSLMTSKRCVHLLSSVLLIMLVMTMVVSVCAQAQAYGNPIEHYGAPDVGLKNINQEGPIQQLMGTT